MFYVFLTLFIVTHINIINSDFVLTYVTTNLLKYTERSATIFKHYVKFKNSVNDLRFYTFSIQKS